MCPLGIQVVGSPWYEMELLTISEADFRRCLGSREYFCKVKLDGIVVAISLFAISACIPLFRTFV